MVSILQDRPRKQSFKESLGESLGQGLEQAVADYPQRLGQRRASRAQAEALQTMGLGELGGLNPELQKIGFSEALKSRAGSAKEAEKMKSMGTALNTIGEMRQVLGRGHIGKGSSFSKYFNKDVRKDRAMYEQLGKSLIPLVAAGVPIRNQKEFEEYKKVLTDPNAFSDEIEGALEGLERLLQSSLGTSDLEEIDFEEKKKATPLGSLEPQEEVQELSTTEEPSKIGSLLKAGARGLIKGARGFSPMPSLGAVPRDMQEKLIERFLPKSGTAGEDIVEFSAENLPALALGGEGLVGKGLKSAASSLGKKALSAVGGGLAKKAAKETSMPEWAQEMASAIGMSAPDLLKAPLKAKVRAPSAKKAVEEFLRSKGLSEKEMGPILQSKGALGVLGKAAHKWEEKPAFVRGAQEKLGQAFESIRERGVEAGPVRGEVLRDFEENFFSTFDKIPRAYRKLIKKDVEELFSRPVDFKELADFNKSLNALVGGVEGGKAAVSRLKKPVEETMAKMNPQLYKEHKLVNEAYSDLSRYTDKLKRNNASYWMDAGEIGSAVMGIATLNPAMLSFVGPRVTADLMLRSPRLHNLHLKLWDAVLHNSEAKALKILEAMKKVSDKEN